MWGRRVILSAIELQPGAQVGGKQGVPAASGNLKDSFSAAFGASLRESAQTAKAQKATSDVEGIARASAETGGKAANAQAGSGLAANELLPKLRDTLVEAEQGDHSRAVSPGSVEPIIEDSNARVSNAEVSNGQLSNALASRADVTGVDAAASEAAKSSSSGAVSMELAKLDAGVHTAKDWVIGAVESQRIQGEPADSSESSEKAVAKVAVFGKTADKETAGSEALNAAAALEPVRVGAPRAPKLGADSSSVSAVAGKNNAFKPVAGLNAIARESEALGAAENGITAVPGASVAASTVAPNRSAENLERAQAHAWSGTILTSAAIAGGVSTYALTGKALVAGKAVTAKGLAIAEKTKTVVTIQNTKPLESAGPATSLSGTAEPSKTSEGASATASPAAALGQDGAAVQASIAQSVQNAAKSDPAVWTSTAAKAVNAPAAIKPGRRTEIREVKTQEAKGSTANRSAASVATAELKVESSVGSNVAATAPAPVHAVAVTHVLPADASAKSVSGSSGRVAGGSTQAVSRVPVRAVEDLGVQGRTPAVAKEQSAVVRETASPVGRPAVEGVREEDPKQQAKGVAEGPGVSRESASAVKAAVNSGGSSEQATAQTASVNAGGSVPVVAAVATASVHAASAPVVVANATVAHAGNGATGSIVPAGADGVAAATHLVAAPAIAGVTASGATSASGNGVAGTSRTDLAAIAEPHRTLATTPTSLEVGVPDGTQGWLKIRAEVGEQGQVNASLAAGSSASQEMLHRELPALNAYLHSEQLAVTATVSERSFAGVGDDAGRASAANTGLTHGGTAGGGPQSESGRPGDNGQPGVAVQQGTAAQVDSRSSTRGYDGGGTLSEMVAANGATPGFEGESGQWLNVRA